MLPGLLMRRRVLMTTDAVGGIWTYGLDLGRGLASGGALVTLAVLGPALDSARRRQAEAAGLVVLETGQSPEWLAEDQAALAATAEAVASIARDCEANLVHLNHPALAGAARFPCPVVGVAHSCVATWWAAVRGTDLPADFRWRTQAVAAGYAAIDRLVVPSAALAAATARTYPAAPTALIVHNGRAATPVGPARDLSPTVFTAGRLWDEGKDLATLDRAAARLDCRVEAAGALQGPNGSIVCLDAVATLGPLTEAEVAARLAARPIYASPALYEPFGLAVVEAAQARCALVLSDIPSFRELWEGVAVFVPPRDDAALAGAIESLMRDPARREALGRAARDRAANYTVEAMREGTLAVYSAVLGMALAAAS